MKKTSQKTLFCIFALLLSIVYLGPSLLSSGGLSVLDFVAYPFTQWKPWYSQTLQWHSLDMLKFLFGGYIASKMYFIGVFLFGIGTGYRLGTQIHHMFRLHQSSLLFVQISSTLFLLLNPWTYERFITQPGIALGMFCIALTLGYVSEYISSQKKYSMIWASIFAGSAFLFFPHASVLLCMIAIVTLLFYGKRIEKRYLFIAPCIILLLNAHWLIGTIFFKQEQANQIIETFDWANIEGFQGNDLGIGTELTHMLLFGFWGERFHILTPEKFNSFWYIFGGIGIVCIFYGALLVYKQERKYFFYLTTLAVISFILSLGISSPLFSPVNTFLYQYIPGYIGMREPQKWLGVTMIIYALFFIIATAELRKKLNIFPNWIPYLLVFVLLNTWNPMNLWAYQHQLLGIRFPTEYENIETFLSPNPGEKVLVLPWHSYMACNWTRGKVIASSQKELFYPLETVVADNLEINTKYSNSTSAVSADVEAFLQSQENNLLIKNNISYIILQKNCAEKNRYDFLKNPLSFGSIYKGNDIEIYSILPNKDETK